nr:SEC-C domain-containing protein [Rhodococcus sp. HNM0569]
MSLLDRVPSGEQGPLYDVVAEYQPVDRPGLGRNQPCWCGSGRKYKKCHLGTSTYPLTDRAAWLYRKAADTLGGPRWLSALSELVTGRVQHWEPGAESVYRAFEDGLVTDVLLFEGGAFADYLVRRGAVLPDDEKELAEAWLAVTRSVYEVVAVDSSANTVTLRDVRTDTSQEVVDVVAAAHVRAGDLICARVVPAGTQLQMPGGFEPVDAARTDALLTLLDDPAATAGDLVEFLTARFAPASAVAANGDPLVACTGTFDLTDHAIARKLGRAFGKGDHDRWTWRDDDRVRAVLRLDRAGEPWQLEVDAMDEDTFGQVLAKISEFDPGSVLRAQTRLPVSELLDDHQGAAS